MVIDMALPLILAAGKLALYGLGTAGITVASIEYGNARARKESLAAEKRSVKFAEQTAAKQTKQFENQMENSRTVWGSAKKGF